MRTPITIFVTLSTFCISMGFGSLTATTSSAWADTSDSSATAIVQKSGQKKVRLARVIVDNIEAYNSKLDLIQKATKSIKMAYFIFSDDESSSLLSQRLIEKAKSGVEVDLLVDLHTNYTRLDVFRMMEEEGRDKSGRQNLHVRFYNGPDQNLVRDFTYVTSQCSLAKRDNTSACAQERKAKADKAAAEFTQAQKRGETAELPFLTSLLFAGLYSKNGTAMQAAVALGLGDDLKKVKELIDSQKGGTEFSPEDITQLKNLLGLLVKAKMKNNAMAKLQLNLALAAYGDKIKPLLDIFNRLAPETMKDSSRDFAEWIHLTDFIHHKLLLVDGQYIQLGGRNIENSYHLNRKLSAFDKYLFRDTDVVVQLEAPNSQMETSYNKLFNFKTMVYSLPQILKQFDNSLLARLDIVGSALVSCSLQGEPDVATCVQGAYNRADQQLTPRLQTTLANMKSRAQDPEFLTETHNRGKLFWRTNGTDELTDSDLVSSAISYVENLSFDRRQDNPIERLMFQEGREKRTQNLKNIQNLVRTNIQNVCAEATSAYRKIPVKKRAAYLANSANRRHILIHQGYVIFPAELMQTLGDTVNLTAVNGTTSQPHCPNVDIEILTNSTATTDLNVINLFASLQIGTLLESQVRSAKYYKQMITDEFKAANFYPPASIRYYEFQPTMNGDQVDESRVTSLHTKIFMFDKKKIFIGSANGDVRSYYMDTNNGFFFDGVPGFIADYSQWVNTQKAASPGSEPVYVEKTPLLLAMSQNVSSAIGRNDEETTQKRLAMLRALYRSELESVANHFASRWRQQAADGTDDDKAKAESKIAKLEKYLPKVISAVAEVNNYIYKVSREFIEKSPKKEDMTAAGALNTTDYLQEISNEFNRRFEVL